MAVGHVFLVDDDLAVQASVIDLLSSCGYQVRAWGDGDAFLSEMPSSMPAVLLADMRMPRMSGLELLVQLKRRERVPPVVYLSGESTLPQGIQAMKLGAFDFILKPFGRDELLSAVAAAIEHDRSQAQLAARESRARAAMARLSPRQREVHDLLLRGYANGEIVGALGISLATAKQYKTEVMRKLGVSSLSALMAQTRTAGVGFPDHVLPATTDVPPLRTGPWSRARC